MILAVFPVFSRKPLLLEKQGEALVLNGEPLDFSHLAEGETLPREAIDCRWIAGDVERINGELHIRLRLPHGPMVRRYIDPETRERVTETLSEAQRFPEPITVTEDGPIALPGPVVTREAPVEVVSHDD